MKNEANQYCVMGGEICKIVPWTVSDKHFTLRPVDGSTPWIGWKEGEFTRLNDEENRRLDAMLLADPLRSDR